MRPPELAFLRCERGTEAHGRCTSLGSPPVSPISAGSQVPAIPRQRKAGLAQPVFETISRPGNACLPPKGAFAF